jgi:hypothetical protein
MSKDRASGLSLPLHAQQPTDVSATDTLIDINYVPPTPAIPTTPTSSAKPNGFDTEDPTTTIPTSYFDSQPNSQSHHRARTSSSSAGSSPTDTLHAKGHGSTARAGRRSSTLPATHRHRTIVLCFDGTGNRFTSANTNVVTFVSLLKKDDKDKQVVYYQVRIRHFELESLD